jgi:hypothetical protein
MLTDADICWHLEDINVFGGALLPAEVNVHGAHYHLLPGILVVLESVDRIVLHASTYVSIRVADVSMPAYGSMRSFEMC